MSFSNWFGTTGGVDNTIQGAITDFKITGGTYSGNIFSTKPAPELKSISPKHGDVKEVNGRAFYFDACDGWQPLPPPSVAAMPVNINEEAETAEDSIRKLKKKVLNFSI